MKKSMMFAFVAFCLALSVTAFGFFSYADCKYTCTPTAHYTQNPETNSNDEKPSAETSTAEQGESSDNDDVPEIGTGTMLLIALCTFSVGSFITFGIVGKLRKKNIF